MIATLALLGWHSFATSAQFHAVATKTPVSNFALLLVSKNDCVTPCAGRAFGSNRHAKAT